jgi:hypothetical protein
MVFVFNDVFASKYMYISATIFNENKNICTLPKIFALLYLQALNFRYSLIIKARFLYELLVV